jgi:hypothetical protein
MGQLFHLGLSLPGRFCQVLGDCAPRLDAVGQAKVRIERLADEMEGKGDFAP